MSCTSNTCVICKLLSDVCAVLCSSHGSENFAALHFQAKYTASMSTCKQLFATRKHCIRALLAERRQVEPLHTHMKHHCHPGTEWFGSYNLPLSEHVCAVLLAVCSGSQALLNLHRLHPWRAVLVLHPFHARHLPRPRLQGSGSAPIRG